MARISIMGEPKISVILPSYNQQEFLPDAIDSALDQVVKPHEIIVIDDGSTDNSLEIAQSYIEKGITVISQVNKGLATARNTGIMNATGDYVLPLDSDDMLLEDCIERVTKKIKETKADVVGISFKAFGKFNEQVLLMENPTLEDFKQGNRIAYCSAIRRSALLECGGYSPRMVHGYEDYALWFDLLTRHKKFVTIQEPLFLYRTRPGTMIETAQQHHDELMAQINKDFEL